MEIKSEHEEWQLFINLFEFANVLYLLKAFVLRALLIEIALS